MKKLIYWMLYRLQFDRIVDFALKARTQVQLLRYKRRGVTINFVPQGGHDLMIAGDITKLDIHPTSHLKSDTFIECSGGVKIGRYFHVGRGLTIFSSAHDYKNATKIPYDENVLLKIVTIGDFVWCGANVTILPGVTIGEGVIVGAASVVTRNVPPLSIVAGNPARLVGERDAKCYEKMKVEEAFY
ncbi:acyltransferase [Rhodoferax ferrireducens]|uniref:acyltransferase n=1 Tax=Rhodoferax ferrireducens TaxID=192843 RepID=UPI00298DE58B|nr:acyltransferase [Rhodoferax ferrireducens]WPC68120.1 acyltransferase [Rhodoferax ferrireducens]